MWPTLTALAGLGWGTQCMNYLPVCMTLHWLKPANNQPTSSSTSTNNPSAVSRILTSRQARGGMGLKKKTYTLLSPVHFSTILTPFFTFWYSLSPSPLLHLSSPPLFVFINMLACASTLHQVCYRSTYVTKKQESRQINSASSVNQLLDLRAIVQYWCLSWSRLAA